MRTAAALDAIAAAVPLARLWRENREAVAVLNHNARIRQAQVDAERTARGQR